MFTYMTVSTEVGLSRVRGEEQRPQGEAVSSGHICPLWSSVSTWDGRCPLHRVGASQGCLAKGVACGSCAECSCYCDFHHGELQEEIWFLYFHYCRAAVGKQSRRWHLAGSSWVDRSNEAWIYEASKIFFREDGNLEKSCSENSL